MLIIRGNNMHNFTPKSTQCVAKFRSPFNRAMNCQTSIKHTCNYTSTTNIDIIPKKWPFCRPNAFKQIFKKDGYTMIYRNIRIDFALSRCSDIPVVKGVKIMPCLFDQVIETSVSIILARLRKLYVFTVFEFPFKIE